MRFSAIIMFLSSTCVKFTWSVSPSGACTNTEFEYVPGNVYGCTGTFSNGVTSEEASSLCVAPYWHVCQNNMEAAILGLTAASCNKANGGRFFASAQTSERGYVCSQSGNDDVFGCAGSSLDFLDPNPRNCGVFTKATRSKFSPSETGWNCDACTSTTGDERTNVANTLASGGGVLCCANPSAYQDVCIPAQNSVSTRVALPSIIRGVTLTHVSGRINWCGDLRLTSCAGNFGMETGVGVYVSRASNNSLMYPVAGMTTGFDGFTEMGFYRMRQYPDNAVDANALVLSAPHYSVGANEEIKLWNAESYLGLATADNFGSSCVKVDFNYERVPICLDADYNTVVSFTCPENLAFTEIQFASFGTPTGSCGSYNISACHNSSTASVVEDLCLYKNSCSINVHKDVFGDPCYGILKHLRVQALCSVMTSSPTSSPVTSGPTVAATTYTAFEGWVNKTDAKIVCNSHGLQLAIIRSYSENRAATTACNLVGKGSCWLGATDTNPNTRHRSRQHRFAWDADGSRFPNYNRRSVFTRWWRNEPNNAGNEKCVEIRSNGYWNDLKCWVHKVALCEYRPSTRRPTRHPTTLAPTSTPTRSPTSRHKIASQVVSSNTVGLKPRAGVSISVCGGLVVVGAPSDEQWSLNPKSGAALIYSMGQWNRHKCKLTYWSARKFGERVATDGRFAYVTAPATQQVFVFDAQNCKLIQEIRPAIVQSGDDFGASLSVGPSTIVVGAPGKDGRLGVVYVYKRNGESFMEQQTLTASTRTVGAEFGYDVAISPDERMIVIGAPAGQTQRAGSAFVFEMRGEDGYVQTHMLHRAIKETRVADLFGQSVETDGETILASCPVNGYVSVFESASSMWVESSRLVPSNAAGTLRQFGDGLAVRGNLIAVGDSSRSTVHVFKKDVGSAKSWVKDDEISNDGTMFGSSVAIGCDSHHDFFVGAPLLSRIGGFAHVMSNLHRYRRPTQTPIQSSSIKYVSSTSKEALHMAKCGIEGLAKHSHQVYTLASVFMASKQLTESTSEYRILAIVHSHKTAPGHKMVPLAVYMDVSQSGRVCALKKLLYTYHGEPVESETQKIGTSPNARLPAQREETEHGAANPFGWHDVPSSTHLEAEAKAAAKFAARQLTSKCVFVSVENEYYQVMSNGIRFEMKVTLKSPSSGNVVLCRVEVHANVRSEYHLVNGHCPTGLRC